MGVIERFNDVALSILTLTVLCVLMTKRYYSNKLFTRSVGYTLFFLILLTFFLSGSKSKVMIFGFSWVYLVFFWFSGRYYNKVPAFFLGFKGFLIVLLALVSAVFVISLNSNGNLIEYAGHLAFRFVYYGDVFLYAFVNDNINNLNGSNPVIGLFGGFLSIFRLLSPQDIYVPIGIQFPLIIHPDLDYITGPNPRHNVVGLFYFGFLFGPFFSFLIGLVLSAIRYKLYKLFVSSFSGFVLYFLITKALITLHVDFDYSLSKFASVLIVFPIILFISYAFCLRSGNGRNRYCSSVL